MSTNFFSCLSELSESLPNLTENVRLGAKCKADVRIFEGRAFYNRLAG